MPIRFLHVHIGILFQFVNKYLCIRRVFFIFPLQIMFYECENRKLYNKYSNASRLLFGCLLN